MSVTAERLMVEVQGDVRDVLRKLDQVDRRTTSMAGRAAKLGRSFGLMFGGAALVAGVKKTIGLAMDFDKTMRQVGVQTDTAGAKLGKLSDLALKMGKDTVYSAQDAGSAMLELAKGGLTSAQIRAGALNQSLKLAAAGGLELSESSNAIVNGMNAFGLSAKNAGQIATALAGAANASSADVRDMTLALSQGSAQANATGMSIQETAAALALFANNGVKGSDAGTSLKTMLQNLIPTTTTQKMLMDKLNLSFVDANGNFVGMAQIAGKLRTSMQDLTQAQRAQAMRTLFGSDASRAALFLYKAGADGVRKMTKATRDQSTVQKMANAAMQGASGAWENFKGSVETAAIQLGTKMLPAFTKAANKGSDFVSDAMTWGPQIQESFGWTKTAATALWDAMKEGVEIAQSLASAWSSLPDGVKSVGTEAVIAALLVPRLTGAITGMATSARTSIMSTVASMRALRAEMAATTTVGQGVGVMAGKMSTAFQVAAGVGGMVALQQGAEKSNRALTVLGGTLTGAAMGAAVGSVIPGLGTAIGGVAGAAVGAGVAIWKTAGNTQRLATQSDVARGAVLDLRDSLNQVTGAANKATRADVLMGAQQAGILTLANRLGVANRDVVAAVLGNEGATKRLNRALVEHSDLLSGTEQIDFHSWLDNNTASARDQAAAIRQNTNDTKTWKQALKGLPPDVKVAVKAIGTDITQRELKQLRKSFPSLSERQIGVIIKAVGTETAVRKVKGVWKVMRDGAKIDPGTDKWADLFVGGLNRVDKKAKDTSTLLGGLGRVKVNPKVDVDDLAARQKAKALRDQFAFLGQMRPTAKAGVTDNASGKLLGILGLVDRLNGKQATATITTIQRTIRQTVKGLPEFDTGGYTGGRSAKDVTGVVHGREYVMDAETTKRALPLLKAIHARKGRVMGYASGGVAGGTPGAPTLTSSSSASDAAKKAAAEAKRRAAERRSDAKKFLHDFVSTIKNADNHFGKVFRELTRTIQRNMSGARESEWMKKSRKLQERLVNQGDRLQAIQKRLTAATEKLSNVRQAKANFVGNVQSGMSSQATVLNAGATAGDIRTSLGVQVAKVKRFAAMLRKLRKLGYARGIVMQIAQAGVEGGYAAAQALVKADPGDRTAISMDFAYIQKTAQTQARALGSALYDQGIAAAQGIVKGLKDKKKDVQELMLNMAMAMRDALRQALGLDKGGKGGGNGQASKTSVAMASTKALTVASLQGGQRAGAQVSFTFITHNPQAEPKSRTINKALAGVGALGLVG